MSLEAYRRHIKALYFGDMRPLPVRFLELDPTRFAMLARSWPAVRRNLERAGYGRVSLMLEGAEPIRFEGDKLLLWFPERSTALRFRRQSESFEPVLAQAIFSVTGLRCGIRPTSGSGAE